MASEVVRRYVDGLRVSVRFFSCGCRFWDTLVWLCLDFGVKREGICGLPLEFNSWLGVVVHLRGGSRRRGGR